MKIKDIDIANENSNDPRATGYFVCADKKIMEFDLRPVVIIAPGGSYEKTAFKEGEPIALRFNAIGYHAIVLDYSVFPAKYPTALREIDTLFAWIQANWKDHSMDRSRIYLCGFSAGGHLVANYACEYERLFLQTGKIKGLILGYPVISTDGPIHRRSFENLLQDDFDLLRENVSIEKNVTSCFPPTFVFATHDDQTVSINNTLLLVAALTRSNVPVESHIFKTGVHGLALGNNVTRTTSRHFNKAFAVWFTLLENWLEETDESAN